MDYAYRVKQGQRRLSESIGREWMLQIGGPVKLRKLPTSESTSTPCSQLHNSLRLHCLAENTADR